MKVKTPTNLLKKIVAALSTKTNELRVRFMIFFLLHKNLLHNKTNFTHFLSTKFHVAHHQRHPYHLKKKNEDFFEDSSQEKQTLKGRKEEEEEEEEREQAEEEEVENLTYCELLEEEEEEEAASEEVVGGGEEAAKVVEDIDVAADLFIKRFKRQIQQQNQQLLQKLHPMETHQQRLLQANA